MNGEIYCPLCRAKLGDCAHQRLNQIEVILVEHDKIKERKALAKMRGQVTRALNGSYEDAE
jgi:hypothetical protein